MPSASSHVIQDEPPFQHKDVIVYRDAPLCEPRRVTRCYFAYGIWFVQWETFEGIGANSVGHCPADHMMRVEWMR